MKVIVTRPRLEADVWVKQLQALHFDAVALPLIHIGAMANHADLTKVWMSLHQYSAVMFVSSNAVRYFYDSEMPVANVFTAYDAIKKIVNLYELPQNLRVWTTGPGTRDALLAQSVPIDVIDSPAVNGEQFDSEALWHIVKNQVKSGDKVLIVRGTSVRASSANAKDREDAEGVAMNGRPWLAEQLTSAGVQVDTVVSYQRTSPEFDATQKAWIHQASKDTSVWLLSSSEAVMNLKKVSGVNWSKAKAIATHPRIAQAARDAGFGVVYESRPLLADVAASIESLL